MTETWTTVERKAIAQAATVVGRARLARRLGVDDALIRHWVHRSARAADAPLPVVEAPPLVPAEILKIRARRAA